MKNTNVYSENPNINKAIRQISSIGYYTDRKNKIYDFYDRIYSFTTENINGYINHFDLKDKSLLTVGSSSDQVFNAFYNGCRDITLLDKNPYTKEYFYLKKAAIKQLEYKDFFNFLSFGGNFSLNYKAFHPKILKKILPHIEEEKAREFWKNITYFSTTSEIRNKLFTLDNKKVITLKKVNNYLKEEESYNKIKKEIKNFSPKFICTNLYNYQLKRNYDNIFLSNIASFYDLLDTKQVFHNWKEHLNEGGKFLVTYLYDTNKDTKYDSSCYEIYNLKKTLRKFKDTEIESFPSIRSYEETFLNNAPCLEDSILVYTKKK